MFGKEALNLINELDLSEEIKPFNEAVFRQVLDEIQTLYEANSEDVTDEMEILEEIRHNQDNIRNVLYEFQINLNKLTNTTLIDASEASRYMSVPFRHAALNRNKRCLLTYVYNRMMRMRKIRWEFGSILPPEINCNLMPLETQWFQAYSKSLASYMKSIGDNHGLNLTMDMVPPKSLYIEVRCLVDYPKLELDDGQIITLKKNTHHLLPRAQCEPLVRQGVLEHITS